MKFKLTKRQLLGLIRESITNNGTYLNPYIRAVMHIRMAGKLDDHEYHHLIIDMYNLEHDVLMNMLGI
jgi:hypothetical protein